MLQLNSLTHWREDNAHHYISLVQNVKVLPIAEYNTIGGTAPAQNNDP